MNRHMFTDGDLYVGARLICLLCGNGIREEGKKYTVSGLIPNRIYKYIISSDNGAELTFCLHTLNSEFYPYDKLSDEEKFLFEVSGNIPGRLL